MVSKRFIKFFVLGMVAGAKGEKPKHVMNDDDGQFWMPWLSTPKYPKGSDNGKSDDGYYHPVKKNHSVTNYEVSSTSSSKKKGRGAQDQVMSMVVNDEFGVMQRILQEFTRRKINIETIVVGKCGIAGEARVVLTIVDRVQAERSVEALSRLHDIIQCELVTRPGRSRTRYRATPRGGSGLIGSIEEVDSMINSLQNQASSSKR